MERGVEQSLPAVLMFNGTERVNQERAVETSYSQSTLLAVWIPPGDRLIHVLTHTNTHLLTPSHMTEGVMQENSFLSFNFF